MIVMAICSPESGNRGLALCAAGRGQSRAVSEPLFKTNDDIFMWWRQTSAKLPGVTLS